MAVFEMADEEEWLPGFAVGNGLRAQHIRLHHKDGSRQQYVIPAAPADRRITVTDERAVRHMEADPRFTRVS
jgi:hypothetical protein